MPTEPATIAALIISPLLSSSTGTEVHPAGTALVSTIGNQRSAFVCSRQKTFLGASNRVGDDISLQRCFCVTCTNTFKCSLRAIITYVFKLYERGPNTSMIPSTVQRKDWGRRAHAVHHLLRRRVLTGNVEAFSLCVPEAKCCDPSYTTEPVSKYTHLRAIKTYQKDSSDHCLRPSNVQSSAKNP
jgi:hypothetical protein